MSYDERAKEIMEHWHHGDTFGIPANVMINGVRNSDPIGGIYLRTQYDYHTTLVTVHYLGLDGLEHTVGSSIFFRYAEKLNESA